MVVWLWWKVINSVVGTMCSAFLTWGGKNERYERSRSTSSTVAVNGPLDCRKGPQGKFIKATKSDSRGRPPEDGSVVTCRYLFDPDLSGPECLKTRHHSRIPRQTTKALPSSMRTPHPQSLFDLFFGRSASSRSISSSSSSSSSSSESSSSSSDWHPSATCRKKGIGQCQMRMMPSTVAHQCRGSGQCSWE
jgi:hypothetical protein